jgi:hypothetical protein
VSNTPNHIIDTITAKLRGDDLTPRQRAERAEHSALNDETYLRLRLSAFDYGAYVLWRPTAAVLRVASEALERGTHDVFTDDPNLKIRRAENYTDTGDGVPLAVIGPGGDFNREVRG